MSGFCKPDRVDRCSNGGGLLLYIRKDIPFTRLLTEYKSPENVECLFVEINIRKKYNLSYNKCCSHNSHRNDILTTCTI